MRRRNEWHAPTANLLNWASDLGVEVPTGISARELYALLRTTQTRRVHAKLKQLDLQEGVRFRRKQDGVTYTLRYRFMGGRNLTAFNEKARVTVTISIYSFLEFYEVID